MPIIADAAQGQVCILRRARPIHPSERFYFSQPIYGDSLGVAQFDFSQQTTLSGCVVRRYINLKVEGGSRLEGGHSLWG